MTSPKFNFIVSFLLILLSCSNNHRRKASLRFTLYLHQFTWNTNSWMKSRFIDYMPAHKNCLLHLLNQVILFIYINLLW
ncbi:hypothetical protein BDF19DRAFT_446188 [Syncephalis fuscata]|nr:hypothetical protein BDF19DRAFT_446188 [Syncephalis fuscata]